LNEVATLKCRIACLEDELSGSKELFDAYRDKTTQSLQKYAATAELLDCAMEESRRQSARADEAVERINHIEILHGFEIESVQSELAAERASNLNANNELEAIRTHLVCHTVGWDYIYDNFFKCRTML